MAEEEVTVASTSPADNHKRKLDDLEHEPEPVEHEPEAEAEAEAEAEPTQEDDADADADASEAKRPRLDDQPNGSAPNGYEEKVEGDAEQPLATEDDGVAVDEETVDPEKNSEPSHVVDEPSEAQVHEPEADKTTPVHEEPSHEAPEPQDQDHPASDDHTITRKMEVPNNKVGVLIGKAGETIRSLQFNSGAKIQIMRDSDADPHATGRPVELIGTLENINKAEKLIKDVIAEADAGGSPALVARGFGTVQAVAGDQLEIQVPNEKVGLIIGKGGDTIKGLQTKSGARIQLVPQPSSDGKESKERTVRVTGDKRQIEIAKDMILEVMSQPVRPSTLSSSYGQQSFRPRGGAAAPQWGPRGGHPGQFPGYDYHQRGQYSSHSPQYPPHVYGNYPPQQGPRGGFGPGWEQRPPVSMQGHPSQANYNYGHPQGPDYGHSYPHQAQHGQGYVHGYTDVKYDNQMAPQNQYGHGPSQPTSYPQSGAHPSYGAHEQYNKPPSSSYGMNPQAQPYGHPRANQPGEGTYQGPVSSTQGYGANVPHQQQYPYAPGGQVQQTYPGYGSTPSADGYNQPQAAPASGPGYPQQSAQPAPGYGQPVPQQAPAYVQAAPAGGYSTYPSQPAYTEQQQPTSNAGYGYQGPVDQTYSAAQASTTYSMPFTGQQAYTQATPVPASAPVQAGYDQSMAQPNYVSGGPAAAYVKSVSPQPVYAQYDANQMYGPPR